MILGSRRTEQQNLISSYNASEVLNANSDHDFPCFLELMLTPAGST